MNWNPNQNDPYASPGGYYSQGGQQYDPYARPSSGSGLTWLWVILGGGGLFILLCCGACCGLGWFGLEENERQIQAMFEDHPAVVDEVGNVQTVERDWTRTSDDEDVSISYYNVQGDRGDAVIVIREGPLDLTSEELDIEWAKLELDSGEQVDLYP